MSSGAPRPDETTSRRDPSRARPWLLGGALALLAPLAALPWACGSRSAQQQGALSLGQGPPGEVRPQRPPPSVEVGQDRALPPARIDDEAALLTRMRERVDLVPAEVVALAVEGERRFGDSAFAPERAWLKVRALVHLEQIAAARDEARRLLARHPRSPYAAQVEQLTGVHPRPPLGPTAPAR